MVDQRTAVLRSLMIVACVTLTTASSSEAQTRDSRTQNGLQRPARTTQTSDRVGSGQQPRVLAAPDPDRAARRAEANGLQRVPSVTGRNGQPDPRSEPTFGPPRGFPLSDDDAARVDKILNYWERHTAGIKTYQASFRRENYDFVFGSQTDPKTIDIGTVRYSAPDKGMMQVKTVYDVVVDPNAQDPTQRKKYVEKKDLDFGEYWVCDGDAIYQFDSRTKTVTETQLPPDLRGKAIGEGPLPFMFGAKAETMKERYWIREVKMTNNPKGDYFLEAIPKRQQDAANFDSLLVKLSVDGKRLFPSAMRVNNKQGRINYTFEDSKPNDPRDRVASFLESFVRPKTPRGWTKVVEPWDEPPTAPQQANRGQPQSR